MKGVEPVGPVELADAVRDWVHGWARARGVTATQRRPGLWHVPIDAPSRREELVVVAPSADDLAAFAADHRGEEDVWVTAVPPVGTLLDGLQLVEHAEALMATALEATARPDRAGLRLEHLHADEAVVHLAYDVDGEQAARGVVTVVGDLAVFDRILTTDAFRRRGFGRDVMAALTAEATERGASRGLLVASHDGQALYRALGWRTLSAVTTYAPVPA